jgi:arabinose-5-phosphate isomerase
VTLDQTLQDVILLMTKYPVSGCAVVDDKKFVGILVEGDIRRTFTKANLGLQTKVKDIANLKPITIGKENLASEALLLMEGNKRSIQILPVIEDETFLGFIRLHELLKEGFSLPR